jgi:hypothetical protein
MRSTSATKSRALIDQEVQAMSPLERILLALELGERDAALMRRDVRVEDDEHQE